MRYAILIGCVNYINVNKISYAKNDVESVYDTLCEFCDYKKENVVKVVDDSELNNESIYEKIAELTKDIKENDTFLLYFSGHGMKHGDTGFLLFPNYDKGDIENTAMSITKLNVKLNNLKCNKFLIFDACYAGILSRNGINNVISSIDAKCCGDKTFVTLAASSENTECYSDLDLNNGVFTYYFNKVIKDLNVNSEVIVEDIKSKIEDHIVAWCDKNGCMQYTTFNGVSVGKIPFAIRNDKKGEIEL